MTTSIVSASAGTGKTTRLAEELVRAIVEEGVRPEAVVATTFTRKAAAELQARVRQKLLAQGRVEDAQRLQAARIGTVNAVCARLVEDFAFELGLSPKLTTLDEALSEESLRAALAEAVTEEQHDELDELTRRIEGLDWLRAVKDVVDRARSNGLEPRALAACAQRSADGVLSLWRDVEDDANALDRKLREVLEPNLELMRALPPTDRTAVWCTDAQRVLELLKNGQSKSVRWSDWRRLAEERFTRATNAVSDVAKLHEVHPRLHKDVARTVDLVFALAQSGLQVYGEHKHRWGVLDFVDQEALAQQLLARPDLEERLRDEIELVLIDEFQDTSPLQLAIFLRLSRLAKRSVWVGDPKQAIFAFRGTDPALMESAIHHMPETIEEAPLAVSHRSRPGLVELTSRLFTRAFFEHGLPESHVHIDAASKTEPEGLGAYLERWHLDGLHDTDRAKCLASGVQALLDDDTVRVRDPKTGVPRRPRPSDIAVFARTNDACLLAADALASIGVAAVLPQTGLCATVEVRTALAGLKLWADADDSLALAELGRLIVHPDDPQRFLARLLEAERATSFIEEQPVQRLRAAYEAQPTAGVVGAVDAVVAALELRELSLRWGDSAQRHANLGALRAMAVRYQGACAAQGRGASVAGFLAHTVDVESQRKDERGHANDRDAVVVTTWHRSKGLEWPIAVLFHLEWARPADALGVHVESDVEVPSMTDPLAGRWIRYWPNPYGRRWPLAFRRRVEQHKNHMHVEAKDAAEQLRLLYVGWTRARDRVVLAGGPDIWSRGILKHLATSNGPILSEPGERVRWLDLDVDVVIRTPAPREPHASARTADAGPALRGARAHPPAFVSPSTIVGEGEASNLEVIGARLVPGDVRDWAGLGEAVHGFLATVDLDVVTAFQAEKQAAAWMQRFGVEGALEPHAVVDAARALRAWALKRWPDAKFHRELPLAHKHASGTVVRGFIDLLIETAEGFVVVDHKSYPGGADTVLARAASFAGQLGAYAAAVRAATSRPVLGAFIHFPVGGFVVEVGEAMPAKHPPEQLSLFGS